MPRPRKIAEPEEPVANVQVNSYDPTLAIQALTRALQVVEHMNLTNWSVNSNNMKRSLTLPMEYAIEAIKEMMDGTK